MSSFVVEVATVSYAVQVSETTVNLILDSPLSPQVLEVQVPGLQGPPGPVGPQGTAFAVSATAPDDPEEGMLWLDIS